MDPVSKAQLEVVPQKRHQIDPATGKATQFKPGNRANPGGRPKKAQITKIYEEIFANKTSREEIKDAVEMTLKSGRMAGVLLLREAAERLEGKVSQEMEITGLTAMTDEELTKRVAAKLAKLNEPTTRTA